MNEDFLQVLTGVLRCALIVSHSEVLVTVVHFDLAQSSHFLIEIAASSSSSSFSLFCLDSSVFWSRFGKIHNYFECLQRWRSSRSPRSGGGGRVCASGR